MILPRVFVSQFLYESSRNNVKTKKLSPDSVSVKLYSLYVIVIHFQQDQDGLWRIKFLHSFPVLPATQDPHLFKITQKVCF